MHGIVREGAYWGGKGWNEEGRDAWNSTGGCVMGREGKERKGRGEMDGEGSQ
jgi:hypothetical protein